MENYESELFKKEEGGEVNARQAAENLNSILIKFEQKIEKIEEKRDDVHNELSAVKDDMKEAGDVPDQFVDLEQRMESNMNVVDDLIEFIEQEQDRLETILNNANEDIEDGREKFAMEKLKNAEEVDSQRLDEARQKFENQWSQLLK